MANPIEIKQLVESRLGYAFKDSNLMLEALKSAGSGMNLSHLETAKDGNKRLAQVGDAAMKLALLDTWYHSDADRASANRQVSLLGSQQRLATRGQELGLAGYISTNPCHGAEPPTPLVIAKAIQALLGAIWFDSGQSINAVRSAISSLGL